MSQTYRRWQNAWRDDPLASVTLELPDDWTVTEYRMPADDHRPLTGAVFFLQGCFSVPDPNGRPAACFSTHIGQEGGDMGWSRRPWFCLQSPPADISYHISIGGAEHDHAGCCN